MIRLMPYTVLLAEVLVFYRKVLFSSHWSIPWDLRGYHLPLATFAATSLGKGELPLWDPYTYCGFPFYANLQAQLFYPPAWLTFLASNLTGGKWLLDLLEWQIVIHVLLGGVFTFLLLRKLNSGRAAATLGATVFQLGGYFASQAQHLGAMNAGTWLPLAWLSILHLRERPDKRWLALLALSLSLAFLAGFPAAAVVVYGSCLLLAGVLMVLRRASLKLAGMLAAACLWAGMLSAVQLLPTLELTRRSTAALRGQWFGNGGGVPLQALVSLVAPDYYHVFDLSRYSLPWNPTFLYLYCSLAGLLLAAAVVVLRRSKYWAVFSIVTLLSAFWMLGQATPVARTVYRLLPEAVKAPMYSEFAMLSFVLGVAVLAGLGAQAFIAPRGWLLSSLAVAVVAIDLIVAGSGRPMNRGGNDPGSVVTSDRFEGSAETLARVRQLVRQTTPPARVEAVKGSVSWPTTAPVTEVPTANGDQPLALLRLLKVRLLFAKGDPWARCYEPVKLDSPVMDLLNVRYILSREQDPPGVAEAGLARLGPVDGHFVFENKNVLPRFFLVGRMRRVRDAEEGLAVMRAPDFDPRVLAVAEGPIDFAAAPLAAPVLQVRVVEYKPRQLVLEVDSPAPAYLVSSEAYFPGWRAYVDGVQHPLFLTNVAFRGMPVPAGRHTITMRFEPAILGPAALSLFGLALVIVALTFGNVNRLKPASRSTCPN